MLLIVDEAQNLPDAALEDIRMLSNLQTDDRILLQIMLVGQPELKNRLNMPAFRQLAQRIAVSYHITPLDEVQTRHYIGYRIDKAGGEPDLFTPEAITKIYSHSGGNPRSINLMCDTALVYGFADNLDCIDAAVIDKVIKDKVCMSVNEGTSIGRNRKGSDGQERKIEARTKYARLLKMEEAKQALRKEMDSKKLRKDGLEGERVGMKAAGEGWTANRMLPLLLGFP